MHTMAFRRVRCDCDVLDIVVLALLTIAVRRDILMNIREHDYTADNLQKVR